MLLFYYSSSCFGSATNRAHTPLPIARTSTLCSSGTELGCWGMWYPGSRRVLPMPCCACPPFDRLLGMMQDSTIALVLCFAERLYGEGLGAAPSASPWGVQPLQHRELGSAQSRAWKIRSCRCQQSRASPAAQSQQEGCGSDLRSGVLLFGSLRKKALSSFLLINKASSCCSLLIWEGKQGTFEIIHELYEIHSRTSTSCPVARLCLSPGRGELYCLWTCVAPA